jgi:hypothetical protein
MPPLRPIVDETGGPSTGRAVVVVRRGNFLATGDGRLPKGQARFTPGVGAGPSPRRSAMRAFVPRPTAPAHRATATAR